MKDIVVIQELQRRGYNFNNVEEVVRYEAVERKPRHLDKAPSKLTFTRATNIQEYGCCSEFIITYNDIMGSSDLDVCYVDLKGAKRLCDKEVFVTLQTLIQRGYTFKEDLASACFDLFRVIIMAPGDVLTRNAVYAALSKYHTDSYYAKELLTAISMCLFGDEAYVAYWVNLCDFTGYYSEAIKLGKDVIASKCTDEKSVNSFLRELYKEAKADKEFMDKVYKPGANKWLIPMLYYLHDEYPEVLDPGNNNGGFA